MMKRGAGKGRKVTGVILIAAGVILGLTLRFLRDSIDGLPLVLFVAQPLMIVGGAFLYWRGRQYAARSKAEAIITDSKADVLYLRSFRSDASTKRQVFSSILTPSLVSGFATEEEQLAHVLRPFGDLVAIGRPGEVLPTPGAARMYTSDAEWQDVVKRQMRAARLVVIRAGAGENLLWELEQAVKTVDPKKLLILVLYMRVKDYESFRNKVREVLGLSLPGARGWFGRSGFIRFAPDWRASFLPLRVPYFRSGFKPQQRMFQWALRPVFESFGLEWQPPPVSAIAVTVVAVFGLVAAFLLYATGAYLMEDRGKGREIASPAIVEPKAPAAAPAAPEPTKAEVQSREFLLQVAGEINKTLPKMIDKETELRTVTAGEGRLIYNYTLVNYAAAELDRDKFLASVKEQVEAQACQSEKMKALWENGVSAHYTYAGNDGRPLGRVIVTPKRCGF